MTNKTAEKLHIAFIVLLLVIAFSSMIHTYISESECEDKGGIYARQLGFHWFECYKGELK